MQSSDTLHIESCQWVTIGSYFFVLMEFEHQSKQAKTYSKNKYENTDILYVYLFTVYIYDML